MSHELETGLFIGEKPWHGLGVILPDETELTTGEALKQAGLDWEVKLVNNFANLAELEQKDPKIEVPLQLANLKKAGSKSVVRVSDGSVLGTVGTGYRPYQNEDAFKWFDPLVLSKKAKIVTAGSLKKGKRVWILGKINDNSTAEVLKGDVIERYVLLAHGHDGTLAIRVGFTNIRVVCNNTLTAAVNDESDATKLLRVRHTSRTLLAMEEVQQIMDLDQREFAATIEQYKYLAAMGCDEETMVKFVREVYAPKHPKPDEACPRIVAKMKELFEAGIGMDIPGVRGSWLAAIYALTEYVTHHCTKDQENKLDSQWFGSNAGILSRGMKVALNWAAIEHGKRPSVAVPITLDKSQEIETDEGVEIAGYKLPQDAAVLLSELGNEVPSVAVALPQPPPQEDDSADNIAAIVSEQEADIDTDIYNMEGGGD